MLSAVSRAALATALLLPVVGQVATAAEPPPIEHFLERDSFGRIEISPDGRHLAASAPMDKGGALVVLDRETLQLTGHFYAGERFEVTGFWWASDERLVMTVGEKVSGLEAPVGTGELFAMNYNGDRILMLAGMRAGGAGTGSNIKGRRGERISVFPVDTLIEEADHILVGIVPFSFSTDPYTTLERMDIRTGARKVVAKAPVQRASFVTDPAGEVRFALGAGVDNADQLYFRAGQDDEWALLNDEGVSGRDVVPIGFSADGKTAYLQVSQPTGPDAIETFNVETRERAEIYRHSRMDPSDWIRSFDGRAVLGVVMHDPRAQMHFFVSGTDEERLLRSLAAAFEGQDVGVSSVSEDGKWAVVAASSDRNPGDFYLYDREARRARHIGSRSANLDPETLGSVTQVLLNARDGQQLEGFLTVPPGAEAKNLPVIVHPHGGPFGVREVFGYDPQAQILATRGYAVLQLNFRGSGGYGRAFERAGYRQWGRAMQDDITDATRWLIEQGMADPERICIFGASYGGYASLMAVAKEPDLYACAIGYVGVYDLEMMYRNGDIPQRNSGKNYLKDALGEDGLRETSPVRLAERITAPVFLVAGGADRRTPIAQTEAMERALKAAGRPPETLYKRNEGHGFYAPENRLELQTKLLAFLERHIGAGRTSAAPASP